METKKCAVLFSGGKDSCYAAYLAKKKGYELSCLISIFSENKESYMFHTVSISSTKKQAESMEIPIIIQKTKGKKEEELEDLEKALKKAKEEYSIDFLVSGAIASNYQKSRVDSICKKMDLESVSPLWHENEIEYLKNLIKEKFEIILTGVSAYPLDKSWIGRKIDKKFIEDIEILNQKYKINPSGEGGEFETLVLNCPLFKKELKIKNREISSTGENSWEMEVNLE